MTYEEYLKIEGCKHQYVIPSMNTENVSVFCIKGIDSSNPKNVPPWRRCNECCGNECKDRELDDLLTEKIKNKLNSKNINVIDEIERVNDASILQWAFLYWIGELDSFEEALEEEKSGERIKYLCDSIVEANLILVEIYNKLIAIPDFDIAMLGNVEWMNKFWK